MEYEKFKEKLEEADLTLKSFSDLCGVSYSTCNNWRYAPKEGKQPEAPAWVESWLQLYMENKTLLEMKKLAVKMSELN